MLSNILVQRSGIIIRIKQKILCSRIWQVHLRQETDIPTNMWVRALETIGKQKKDIKIQARESAGLLSFVFVLD